MTNDEELKKLAQSLYETGVASSMMDATAKAKEILVNSEKTLDDMKEYEKNRQQQQSLQEPMKTEELVPPGPMPSPQAPEAQQPPAVPEPVVEVDQQGNPQEENIPGQQEATALKEAEHVPTSADIQTTEQSSPQEVQEEEDPMAARERRLEIEKEQLETEKELNRVDQEIDIIDRDISADNQALEKEALKQSELDSRAEVDKEEFIESGKTLNELYDEQQKEGVQSNDAAIQPKQGIAPLEFPKHDHPEATPAPTEESEEKRGHMDDLINQ